MNKTKIDWAEMSWNPVTGCRHGCPYCYARRTAHRFDAGMEDSAAVGGLHVLESKIKATPYPYGFEPTMHRYRLNQPERQEEPQTVFVCSMADLFGRWVPTSWIVEVLDACQRAPQHRYLFLRKTRPDTWNWTRWPSFHMRKISGMGPRWPMRTRPPPTQCPGRISTRSGAWNRCWGRWT